MPGGIAERRRGRMKRGEAGAAVEKRKGATSPAAVFGYRKRAAKRFKSFCPCHRGKFRNHLDFGTFRPFMGCNCYTIAKPGLHFSIEIADNRASNPCFPYQSNPFEPLQHQKSIKSSSQNSRAALPRFPQGPRKLAGARLLLLFSSKHPLRVD